MEVLPLVLDNIIVKPLCPHSTACTDILCSCARVVVPAGPGAHRSAGKAQKLAILRTTALQQTDSRRSPSKHCGGRSYAAHLPDIDLARGTCHARWRSGSI